MIEEVYLVYYYVSKDNSTGFLQHVCETLDEAKHLIRNQKQVDYLKNRGYVKYFPAKVSTDDIKLIMQQSEE